MLRQTEDEGTLTPKPNEAKRRTHAGKGKNPLLFDNSLEGQTEKIRKSSGVTKCLVALTRSGNNQEQCRVKGAKGTIALLNLRNPLDQKRQEARRREGKFGEGNGLHAKGRLLNVPDIFHFKLNLAQKIITVYNTAITYTEVLKYKV